MFGFSNHTRAVRPARVSLWRMTIVLAALLLVAACGGPASSPASTPPAPPVAASTPVPADSAASEAVEDDDAVEAEPVETTQATEEVPEEVSEDVPDELSEEDSEAADVILVPTPEPEAETTSQTESTPAVPSYSPDTHTLSLRALANGFSQPLYVDHAGDGSGRLFIVEKPGTIQLLVDGVRQDPPFLDIRDRVGSSGFEQGLLGLAFAPNFTESGFFFVNYTDRAGNTVVSRFQVDGSAPEQADPASEFVVLQITQPAANHNGGGLKFGPDGYLWIGTGDGGASGDRFDQGQNPDTLLGKMLRLDVTSAPDQPYIIPEDNPWVTADWNGADVRDEVWAVGLRNPWRYSFDRATGDLWVADVGQNAIEAVHFTPAGHAGGINYGWPILEGSRCYRDPNNCDPTGLDLPVLEYAHGEGDCSITGGYVYRGEQFADLQGAYVFGDYCSGRIWVATPQADGTWESALALSTDLQISSFGEDEAGELYITGLSDGGVYQLVLE